MIGEDQNLQQYREMAAVWNPFEGFLSENYDRNKLNSVKFLMANIHVEDKINDRIKLLVRKNIDAEEDYIHTWWRTKSKSSS